MVSRLAQTLLQIGCAAVLAFANNAHALHVAHELRLGVLDFDWIKAQGTHEPRQRQGTEPDLLLARKAINAIC